MNDKLVMVIGQSGSGKSTLLDSILSFDLDKNYNKVIQTTTRPKRQSEEDGIDYHFIDMDSYLKGIINSEYIEYAVFNEWGYGTNRKDLVNRKINIGVFNPKSLNFDFPQDIDIKVIYVKANDKTRLLRQLMREDNPNVQEILRRFEADKKDFENFEQLLDDKGFNYIVIDNSGYGITPIAANLERSLREEML